MAQPRTPPELIDDVIREILIRIPPDESAYPARASLVCKLWRRILSDPDFTRRYREFYRTPPLLGFLHDTDHGHLFFPTTAACPFPKPAIDRWTHDFRQLWAYDCRHGRVLLRHADTLNFVVWDPITGDREELHLPHIPYVFYSAMVLCAAAGCDHCDCLGGGPFLVVFVGIKAGSAHGCVYSSETRAWGTPVSLYLGRGYVVDLKRAALIGDDAYFIVRDGATILKYNLDKNCLSAIAPPDGYGRNIVVMPTDDGSLGLAGVRDSNLYPWLRKVNPKGFAGWVQYQVIELDKLLPVNSSCNQAKVIGFAEGVGVLFVRIDTSTFMIELKSGQVRKVGEFGRFYNALPFMSFYTPGSARLPLSPAEKN